MLRWPSNSTCFGPCKACLPARPLRIAPISRRVRYATVATEGRSATNSSLPKFAHKYQVFTQLRVPCPERAPNVRSPEPWLALVERCLPPHLRQKGYWSSDPPLGAVDCAEILLAARGHALKSNGIDLLRHLGVDENRWDAVLWLVNHVVDGLDNPTPLHEIIRPAKTNWDHEEASLQELSSAPVTFQNTQSKSSYPDHNNAASLTLERLTGTNYFDRVKSLRRDALGQVWQSLGSMIISSTDGVVKPEVLEIIAYLHHHEIMPSTIYNRITPPDSTAIQPPPTLHLLSSLILTSLSDAAWRAHERTRLQTIREKENPRKPLQPNIPGTAYRVHSPGVRPEIWLELILWSCLHGGWILEGSAILAAAHRAPPGRSWKPLSWRSLMPDGYEDFSDWDSLARLYNTRGPSKDDNRHVGGISVERTISSEVTNAFVDALLTQLDSGVGERGAQSKLILDRLVSLRSLLSSGNLNLGAGSWDAVVVRFVDSQRHDAVNPGNFLRLLDLSPGYGREIKSQNTRDMPPYVLDGSAAVLGISHRALDAQIKSGNIAGALHVLKRLRDYTDANKRQSLLDFFQSQSKIASQDGGLFTGNYSPIDFPAFDPQIPSTTLGALLELIVNTKEYDIGEWLFYSQDVDGPLINQSMLTDPAVIDSLVKFATETGNSQILTYVTDTISKFSADSKASRNGIRSFLNAQFSLNSWNAAARLLMKLKWDVRESPSQESWNSSNLATLARAMLLQTDSAEEAHTIFTNMVEGEYDSVRKRTRKLRNSVEFIIMALTTADPYWTKDYLGSYTFDKYHVCQSDPHDFNIILEGVVSRYGSSAGRRLLGIFWSHSVRAAQNRDLGIRHDKPDVRRLSKFHPKALESPERQRSQIHLGNGRTVVLYDGLRPDLRTIGIIFHRALTEVQEQRSDQPLAEEQSPLSLPESAFPRNANTDTEATSLYDTSPIGTVIWSIKRLFELGMAKEHIWIELRSSLSEDEIGDIESQLDQFWSQDGEDVDEPID